MFRRRAFTHHRVGDSNLLLCSDENRIENQLATPIAVRTLRHCRLAPTNRG
ncbi:MAG: hypothetical protein LBC02_03610 [Planctomycetaceae bacterium]|nr:hypothetical protein [Planctomycetaceae bacterium]